MRKVSPGEVFVYTIGKNVVSKQGRTDIPVDVTTIHLDFFVTEKKISDAVSLPKYSNLWPVHLPERKWSLSFNLRVQAVLM